jgi:hypothetical protein
VEQRSLQEFSANLNRGKSVMSDRRIELGFERTECACPDCKRYCEFMPGMVIPSDLECLTEYLGYSNPVEFALENLLSSPGATVINGGQIRQVPSLVPARDQNGACLFLDEESSAESTVFLLLAAVTSTTTKPMRKQAAAATPHITKLTWHGKAMISMHESGYY